jgi:hypothetical protein
MHKSGTSLIAASLQPHYRLGDPSVSLSPRTAVPGAAKGCYGLLNSAPTSCSTRSTTAVGALAISSASRLRQSRLRS